MFDGVLFDLDGTLWNATVRICESWNRALARHPEIARPPVTVPEVEATMGLLLPDIARRILPGEREETRAMVLKEQEGEELALLRTQGGVLYPAVEETLAALSARAKLFVVSNCQDGYIQTFYAAHKLERYFTGFECAGRTGSTAWRARSTWGTPCWTAPPPVRPACPSSTRPTASASPLRACPPCIPLPVSPPLWRPCVPHKGAFFCVL